MGGPYLHIPVNPTRFRLFPTPFHPTKTQGYEEATANAVRMLLVFAEPSDGWRLNFERRGVRAYKRERVGTYIR